GGPWWKAYRETAAAKGYGEPYGGSVPSGLAGERAQAGVQVLHATVRAAHEAQAPLGVTGILHDQLVVVHQRRRELHRALSHRQHAAVFDDLDPHAPLHIAPHDARARRGVGFYRRG